MFSGHFYFFLPINGLYYLEHIQAYKNFGYKYSKFPYSPPPNYNFPIINVLNQHSTFITTDDSICLLCVVQFMGFTKCIMSCIHYYSIILNNFTALKIFCTQCIHLSFPLPNLWQQLIFLLSLQFCLFQNIMQLEPYTLVFSDYLLSLAICIYISFHSLIAHFSVLMNSISLYYMNDPIYLAICLWKDILVAPNIGSYEQNCCEYMYA